MPQRTSEALVLRTVDYRDADRIVTFLTRDQGRLSGLVRGARRLRNRRTAAMEVLARGRVLYFEKQGKDLVTVDRFEVEDLGLGLRGDLLALSAGLYLAEAALLFLPERQPAADLYDLLLRALDALPRAADVESLLRVVEIRLLDGLGFGPRMDACAACGGPAPARTFSVEQGGLVCPACAGSAGPVRKVSAGLVRFWISARGLAWPGPERLRLDPALNREVKALLYDLLRGLAGREIRSREFLDRLLAERAGRGATP